jgi:hypothetical protein
MVLALVNATSLVSAHRRIRILPIYGSRIIEIILGIRLSDFAQFVIYPHFVSLLCYADHLAAAPLRLNPNQMPSKQA